MSTMEEKIVSEIHKVKECKDKNKFLLPDNELEECLSLFSDDYAPQYFHMQNQDTSTNSSQQPHIPPQPQPQPSTSIFELNPSSILNAQPEGQQIFHSPQQETFSEIQPILQHPAQSLLSTQPPISLQPRLSTDTERKIQQLLCMQRYKDVSKAGELAVRLAVIIIGENTLRQSGLGDNQGKLNPLDDKKMEEIEGIVKRVYKGKGNIDYIWKEKCRTAISKKCQRLRNSSGHLQHSF